MKIEFNLSKEDCDKILEANGYITEEVTVKVNMYDATYSHGSIKEHDDEFVTFREMVAYRIGGRPESFNDQPIENLDNRFKYDEVIKKIAKKKFIALLCD